MSDPLPSPRELNRVVRRNLICHTFEGGLYMGGTAFLAPESVLPKMIEALGGPIWVIALMPALLPAAFAFAGLFVSPFVERLHSFKRWVLVFGIFQRLPYLITGLILLLGTNLDGNLMIVVALTPVVSGLLGGVTMIAWMEMVTRMIAERVRATGWAARYILQAIIGMGAGTVIHAVLTQVPGREGYAWLHLATFALLSLSWMAQLPMHEVPLHPRPQPPSRVDYLSYLRALPGLLGSQPLLVRLIAARFTGMGYLMVFAFLTIHALSTTGRPEADEGFFVTAQSTGTILGSLLAALLGYMSGGRVLLILSRVLLIAMCGWMAINESFEGFLVAYFVLGFGLFLDRVGDLTLAAELCPLERRSTFQALLNFCNLWAFLGATSLGGLVYASTRSFAAVLGLATLFSMASILILRWIPEPRHGSPPVPTQA
jgi:MFS family permease